MINEEPKRPAFQFYPAEWLKDLELRACSPAARGLWVDLLCLMHECVPYGHLTAPKDLVLSRLAIKDREFDRLLAELETVRFNGKPVAYRTPEGVLYSKRMVRDEQLRAIRSENGGRGGRPPRRLAAPPNVEDGFDAEAAFEALWNVYPKKGRTQRPLSQQYFLDRVRTREAFAELMTGVNERWAKSKLWADGFIQGLARFLNEERWREEPEPANKTAADAPVYRPYKPPE